MPEEYERVFVLIHIPHEVEKRLPAYMTYLELEELTQAFASKLEQTLNISEGKPIRVGASLMFTNPVITVHGSLDDPIHSCKEKVTEDV